MAYRAVNTHAWAQQFAFASSICPAVTLSWTVKSVMLHRLIMTEHTKHKALCLEMNQSHRWASRGVPPSAQSIPERWFNGDLLACLIQIPESSRERLEKFKAVPWRIVRWDGKPIEG